MNETEVTTQGLKNVRPGREAMVGAHDGPDGHGPRAAGPERDAGPRAIRRRAKGARSGGERAMVPEPTFTSYYGKPVLNQPVWHVPDVPGYFFLGGAAGAGSVVAAAAQVTGRQRLARVMKLGSTAAAGLSGVALVHDLGRPRRFLNMLRTFKPTSPMSVGSWLLAAYGPAATAAALSEVTGIAPALGATATAGAALLGPAVASYTAALLSDTAVPAWHDALRDMPWVFVASAAASAGGLGMLGAPVEECGPVRALGALGGLAEMTSELAMTRRIGMSAEVYETGAPMWLRRAAVPLLAGGALGALVGHRSRALSAMSGAALLAGSALTRFAIFEAGRASARDPKYTVAPQRERVEGRQGRRADAI